jgi:hypothetical protein
VRGRREGYERKKRNGVKQIKEERGKRKERERMK